MEIIVTGSLGHIGKPLTQKLLQKEHSVTVISSNPESKTAIESLGARAAIGTIEDKAFLTKTFTGADAVYCMVPPNFSEPDQVAYYRRIGKNYVQTIRHTDVQRVVDLSSYGAHLEKGTGVILGAHHLEKCMNELEISVTHVRPGYFYYNLYGFVSMIKSAGFIGANYGDENKLILIAPKDIATAVADELVTPAPESNIRYVVSDDRTCNDIAAVLGKAIGKPDLKWKMITSEQMQAGLEANGVPAHMAHNLVELGEAIHSGILREDYEQHKPAMGNIKMEDFAKEFETAYLQQPEV